MQRVSLPGGWVDFREPEDVPERLRRRVTTMAARAASLAQQVQKMSDEEVAVQGDDLEFLLEFNDAVAICLVMGWSWDNPVNTEGLIDLPAAAYDVIVKHGQTNVARLLPNFSVDPDPKALTEN